MAVAQLRVWHCLIRGISIESLLAAIPSRGDLQTTKRDELLSLALQLVGGKIFCLFRPNPPSMMSTTFHSPKRSTSIA
jgi:hypothetical protein